MQPASVSPSLCEYVVMCCCVMQDGTAGNAAIFGDWDEVSFGEMEAYLTRHNIEILGASTETGLHYVVADGLLSKDHCSDLLPLDVVRLLVF